MASDSNKHVMNAVKIVSILLSICQTKTIFLAFPTNIIYLYNYFKSLCQIYHFIVCFNNFFVLS